MKRKTVFTILFVFLGLFVATTFVLAQATPPTGPGTTPPSETRLPNPLGDDVTDPRQIIGIVINAVLGIVGSIALAVFIFGGVTWMTSGGNPEKITKGKGMLLWAVLGLVVIFTSYAAVRFVIESLVQST